MFAGHDVTFAACEVSVNSHAIVSTACSHIRCDLLRPARIHFEREQATVREHWARFLNDTDRVRQAPVAGNEGEVGFPASH
jgi:hypothetical protein